MKNLNKIIVVGLIATYSSISFAGPWELSLSELNNVTAGTAQSENQSNESITTGGTIVANDSVATLELSGKVTLEGGAQQDTQSVNLVNSSDSLVADGLNVWRVTGGGVGNIVAGEGAISNVDGATYVAEQTNQIKQDNRTAPIVATLSGYKRPERTTQDVEAFIPGEDGGDPITINTNSDRAPLFLEEAQAEYIVIDDSSLTVTHLNEVHLSGRAQQNAQAVNLINASGSDVANGINVAVFDTGINLTGNIDGSLTMNGQINLIQSNVIVQTR